MSAADRYLAELQSILERLRREQAEPIRAAGLLIADTLVAGGILHVFGSGHSHLIAEEAFFRAGGLAPVNPILDRRLLFLDGALASTYAERQSGYAANILQREDVRPGDAAILISNSGRNAVPVEMALLLRERGVRLVAITNLAQSRLATSRHPSGKRLFELCEILLDNCSPDGDAAVELAGTPLRMGPASTVAGAALINSALISAAEEMLGRGVSPAIFSSANVSTADDDSLEVLLSRFADRIRYFRNPFLEESPKV